MQCFKLKIDFFWQRFWGISFGAIILGLEKVTGDKKVEIILPADRLMCVFK